MKFLNFLKKVGSISLSASIAVVICSVFALFYDHAGAKATPKSDVSTYCWAENQFVSNMSEGFSFFITDENGYNNQETFDHIDTLVMGSSHTQAVQVMQDENLTARLNQSGCCGNVYNIGVAGQKIYDIVGYLDSALEYFKPQKYVIIEALPIPNDIDKMQNAICNAPLKSQKIEYNAVVSITKEIPCVKPILYGIENWIKLDNSEKNPENVTLALPDNYVETLNVFLSLISDASKEHGVTPIIFFHPGEILNPDGTVTYNIESAHLDCFAATCKDLGIIFINTTDSFKELYQKEHKFGHGFINTAVGSGHLNKYGHRIIAERIEKTINNLETGK